MNCTPCTYSGEAASFLSVVAEPNRLKIICQLKEGELCVCELIERLKLPQNLLSHHLKSLREFGLLESRKEGQRVYYALNQERLNHYTLLTNNLFALKGSCI